MTTSTALKRLIATRKIKASNAHSEAARRYYTAQAVSLTVRLAEAT
ncbi:MAG: hypothetical protein QQN63_00670 [Nitrosopumilus sp.]